MSLVEVLPGPSALEGMLAHRPELLTKYRTFYQSFWQDALVPVKVLELCRLRVAYIHDCQAELAVRHPHVRIDEADRVALRAGDSARFDAAERAALMLAEHIPLAAHSIRDEWVHAADAEFGHAGCVTLLTALAFFDVTCRWKRVFELPEERQPVNREHLV